MSISIEDLEAFIKLYETGNMHKTARELGLTQPAISYKIKNLEDFFHKNIIIRKSNKNIFFSDFANELYVEVSSFLKRFYQLREYNEFDLKKSTIKISSGEIAGIYFLPTLIKSFGDKYKEINVDVEITSSGKAIEALLSDESDLAFISSKDFPELKKYEQSLRIIEIAPIEIVIIFPKGHNAAKNNFLTLKDLAQNKFPFLARYESSAIQREFLRMVKEEGLSLKDFNIVQRFENSASILSAVTEGLGISIISKLQAQKFIDAGLIDYVPLKTNIKTSLILIDRWNGRSATINSFVDFTKYYVRTFSKEVL
ncbi:MAG: LysR family transcriptional regulator [Thermoplasmatales archaeon]